MRRLSGAVAALACAATALAAAPAAQAEFGFDPAVAAGVTATTAQAGAHPDLTIDFGMRLRQMRDGRFAPDGTLKQVVVDLPPGFVGDPDAVAKCRQWQLAQSSGCPADTQVGEITIVVLRNSMPIATTTRVSNVVPTPGYPATLGFHLLGWPVLMNVGVRSDGDYGLRTTIPDISLAAPVVSSRTTLWGVPADHGNPGPRRAFLTAPTSCGGAQAGAIRVTSWEQPTEVSAPFELPPATGCDQLGFRPSLGVAPDHRIADAPAGMTVDLAIEQSADSLGPAPSQLRDAVVTLPAGMSLSPATADGLVGCDGPPCPDAAKVGTVEIDTPLLADPLRGGVFLARPLPDDRYRLIVVAQGSGVTITLRGSVRPDDAAGQLTTTFDDNPQLPFTRLRMRFFPGPRAPIATPAVCGTHTASARLTPWSGQPASTVSSAFTIDERCARGFAPSFGAGTVSPQAGAFSPFTLRFARADGEQLLGGIRTELPPGLLGMVARVPLCPEPQAAAGTCGPESRVGSTQLAVGAGERPLWVPQPGKAPTAVHLAGPYKGAPYSLSIVVPAQAGPFDLGTVVVRAALHVDRRDAHITAVTDPLPTIVGGIPQRIREVRVQLDRPGFTFNPTSCRQMAVGASIVSTEGAVAERRARFQAGGCAALRFSPALSGRLTGRRSQLRTRGRPGLRVVLRAHAGQANIRRVAFTLPREVSLDLDRLTLCSEEQLARDACPPDSRHGSATATTPVLPQPLTGPVYLIRNPTGGVPSLAIPLSGPIELMLRARTVVTRSLYVRSTFEEVPDAPISGFTIALDGGRDGLFIANRPICARKPIARLAMVAQSGRRLARSVRLASACPRPRTARHGARRRAAAKRRAQRRSAAARRAAARAAAADRRAVR